MPVTVIVRASDLSSSDARTELSLCFDAPRIVIGRAPGCDVRLPDPSISPRHASLRQQGAGYVIVDEGSTNGTYVNGVKLGEMAHRPLEDGALVRVGRIWLELHLDPTAKTSTANASREMTLAFLARKLSEQTGQPATPRLLAVEGPDQGRSLELNTTNTTYVLGRGHGCDLLLDETDASRRHVEIVRAGEKILVRDLGSKNGTFLEDGRLPPHHEVTLRDGETFRIGQDLFVYEYPALVALGDLERVPDEKLEPDSPPPTATHEPGKPEIAPRSTGSPNPPSTDPSRDTEASALQTPFKISPRAKQPIETGWSASDYVVLALALGVLALSAAGLWVFFGW